MSSQFQQNVAPWPKTKSELESAESLLVESFRRWLLGLHESREQHWSMVWNEFAKSLGARDAKAGLSSFAAIIRELGEHGRRCIRYHHVCCPCLGVDEMWLVRLVGSCQRGESKRARLLAEWMVRPEGVGDVLGAASSLARAMQANALIMPIRAEENGSLWDEAPTIH